MDFFKVQTLENFLPENEKNGKKFKKIKNQEVDEDEIYNNLNDIYNKQMAETIKNNVVIGNTLKIIAFYVRLIMAFIFIFVILFYIKY